MGFPVKTGLAMSTCFVALAMAHRLAPAKGLSPGVFREAAVMPGFQKQAESVAEVAPPALAIPSPALGSRPAKLTQARPALAEFLFDDDGSLDEFFEALRRLQSGAGPDHVTVLHYGDSPTTADLITGDVRTLLQQSFGDGGYGYLLVAKPWAWYGHRGTEISDHGWTISTAVGKGRAETYGLGGASFQAEGGGSASRITLRDGAESALELAYLEQPGGGALSVVTGDAILATVSTAADDRRLAWKTIPLPPGTKAVDIKAAGGPVRVFGENFTRSQRGLLYDSLGLNGASTTVLSRGFDAGAWATELQHDQPALVVVNYGTNESGFGAFVDRQYEGELRLAIQKIRNALPNVSILVMSPMDRGQRSGIDEIQTMSTIPRIVAIQKRVAADTHCAFFDTFNAMGGDGTMSRWYNGRPRMVAGDLIHPTPQGAATIAQTFVKNLMQGFDGYKSRKGEALTSRANPAGASAASPEVSKSVTAAHSSDARPVVQP